MTMTETETDAEFLKRTRRKYECSLGVHGLELDRLLRIAERSVKIPDDPTDAMVMAGALTEVKPGFTHRSPRITAAIYRAMLTTALKDTDNG